MLSVFGYHIGYRLPLKTVHQLHLQQLYITFYKHSTTEVNGTIRIKNCNCTRLFFLSLKLHIIVGTYIITTQVSSTSSYGCQFHTRGARHYIIIIYY